MNRLLLTTIASINKIRYPGKSSEYNACISANQYARLIENRFLFRDYVRKEEYKVISYQGEFQQELTFVLPFAYWHYKNGTLKNTISSIDTKEFYFFNDNHEERFTRREWKGWNHSFDIPNMAHCNTFDYSKWLPVPLKEHYQNDQYIFDRPILIIANKYNIEWGRSPINFLDIPTLDRLFSKFKNNYQIIYNRPKASQIVPDHSEILSLNEHNWIKNKHPEVLTFDELFESRPSTVKNFNHLQLLVYANCENFICVHGGTAALASYFGGTNIILSKVGLEHIFKEYDTIFPKLSGARILHATDEKEVLAYASKYFENKIRPAKAFAS